MLIMGPGRDDYVLVMFQITVVGLSHSVGGNELLESLENFPSPALMFSL